MVDDDEDDVMIQPEHLRRSHVDDLPPEALEKANKDMRVVEIHRAKADVEAMRTRCDYIVETFKRELEKLDQRLDEMLRKQEAT